MPDDIDLALRDPLLNEVLKAMRAAEHEHFWPGRDPASHTWQSVMPLMLSVKVARAAIEAVRKHDAAPAMPPGEG
jgi:hypothetical protein